MQRFSCLAHQIGIARHFVATARVSSIAQMCDGRTEVGEALKPFAACCDLIIVIPLYAWERARVMTINDKATVEGANAILG